MSDTQTANGRIRQFSQWVWVGGTGVVLTLGLISFPTIWVDPVSGQIGVEQDDDYVGTVYPWYEEDPAELTVEDGVLRGDIDGGWIPFPADSAPLVFELAEDIDDLFGISQSVQYPAPDGDSPERLEYLWDAHTPVYAVPAETDGRLWFASRLRQWQVQVAEVDAEAIGTTHSGTRSAILRYHGDALSARFTHEGTGIFQVTIVSPGEFQPAAVNGVDDVNATASWNTAGSVLFIVDAAAATGTWTVTVHE